MTPTQPDRARVEEIARLTLDERTDRGEWDIEIDLMEFAIDVATRALAEQREWLMARVCSWCGTGLPDESHELVQEDVPGLIFCPTDNAGRPIRVALSAITRVEYLSRQEAK